MIRFNGGRSASSVEPDSHTLPDNRGGSDSNSNNISSSSSRDKRMGRC